MSKSLKNGQYPPTLITTHPKKNPCCDVGCIARSDPNALSTRPSSPAPLLSEVHGTIVPAQNKVKEGKS